MILPKAFCGCESLVHVHLPQSLGSIGNSAFAGCKKLHVISVPETAKMIGKEAFKDCHQLVGVQLFDGLQRIGSLAFANCKSLVNISIPNSVDHILDRTFNDQVPLRIDNRIGLLKERYARFPVHKICYHSSYKTVHDLEQALCGSNPVRDCFLQDKHGLTPLHVLATTPNPNVEILEYLLDIYPPSVVGHEDRMGMTMLEYLVMQPASRAPLIQIVLQKQIVEKMTSLQDDTRADTEDRVQALEDCEEMQSTVRCIRGLLETVGYHTKVATATLVKLALWKQRMNGLEKNDESSECEIDRASCQCPREANVVAQNVFKYLWQDESKLEIGLSVFPFVPLAALQGTAAAVEF